MNGDITIFHMKEINNENYQKLVFKKLNTSTKKGIKKWNDKDSKTC